ncbi:hypothetical protein [Lentibacillus sp. CBA3610]|uniref:hypothetical protein n=1 Tax=Lentibacillus sp. CBA3610 TaxID=2518176 RepID=UPI0020D2492E|nr:hypothetical protein [Lentibacillus sp. CBA3610]
MKIAIIGATGYGGTELIRLLQQHPKSHFSQSFIKSKGRNRLQKAIHICKPYRNGLQPLPGKIAQDADLVFTATPSGVSSELVPELLKHGNRVIDLSGDFRLKDTQEYEDWYNKKAPDEAVLENAVYGLTEWLDTDLTETQLVSNPGCYPTAALLGWHTC